MTRFEVGQTVYMGRGEKMREMVVAKRHDNPMIPVYQYSFEAPNDGFACGEQSIRETIDGPDLKMSDCWKEKSDRYESMIRTQINTIASGMRHVIDGSGVGAQDHFQSLFGCSVFFKPDLKFANWLKQYANGRMIIDVGSGQGHLVNMLKRTGAKAIGLEPEFDQEEFFKWRLQRNNIEDIDINEILPWTVERAENLINDLGKDKCILIFARPDDYSYVVNGLQAMPKGMEALYIDTEEMFGFNDYLKYFKEKAVLKEHIGVSEDNEKVYSIIR